jgi:hypothetical protein
MPSSTAWARLVAAKKSGARMVEVRIVDPQVIRRRYVVS